MIPRPVAGLPPGTPGARRPPRLHEGVLAACGPAANAAVCAGVARLAGRSVAVVASMTGAALGATPGWRAARADGPGGRVAVVLHGRPGSARGLAPDEVVEGLARRFSAGLAGADPRDALDDGAEGVTGDVAIVAACEAVPGALVALRRGRGLVVAEGRGMVILTSEVAVLPPGLAEVRSMGPRGVSLVSARRAA